MAIILTVINISLSFFFSSFLDTRYPIVAKNTPMKNTEFMKALSKVQSDLHFIKTSKGKSRVVKCKYCSQTMTSHDSKRWRSHLTSSCTQVSPAIKQSLKVGKNDSIAFVESGNKLVSLDENILVGDHSESPNNPFGIGNSSSSISKPYYSRVSKWIGKT